MRSKYRDPEYLKQNLETAQAQIEIMTKNIERCFTYLVVKKEDGVSTSEISKIFVKAVGEISVLSRYRSEICIELAAIELEKDLRKID